MNEGQTRRAMSSGVVFVVLFVAGVLVTSTNSPTINSGDSDALAARKYLDELSSTGHRIGLLVGGYLLILSALAFVWFAVGIRDRLTSVTAGRIVAGLSAMGAAVITVAAITSAVVAGSLAFGNEPLPRDGDTIRWVMELTFPLLAVGFGLVTAALIGTVAVTADHAVTPAWLSYTGWVAALGAVLGVLFFPLVLPMLWYLAYAVIGYLHPTAAIAKERPSGVRPTIVAH